MTSAFCVDALNHASSPNLPNWYLDRRKSLGKPQATETKCGLTLLLGSTSVEKPLRNARDTSRVVQQIDCILLPFFLAYAFFNSFSRFLFLYLMVILLRVIVLCVLCFSFYFISFG